MLIIFDKQVRRGLATLMSLAGVRPIPWSIGSAILLLAQTALATIPVVAMVPLLQLFSAPDQLPATVEMVATAIGTTEPRILIPVVATCIAGVFLLSSVLSILVTRAQAGRVNSVYAEAITALLQAYAAESFEKHRRRATAEIVRNVNLVEPAAEALTYVLNILTSTLTLIGICAVLVIASPIVTVLVVILFGGLMTVAQSYLKPAQKRAGEEAISTFLHAWQIVLPIIEGFREVRLSGSAPRMLDAYRTTQFQLMKVNRTTATLGAVPPALSQVIFAVGIAGIASILFATGSAATAITILGLFAAAAMRALPTINLLFASIGWVRKGEPGLKVLADAVDDLHETAPSTQPATSHTYVGDIEVRDLAFSYQGADARVVDGVDFTIRQHETTAIVGSSGAGKSTLIDLLLGLLDPTGGSISCGGTSIRDHRESWYSQIAVVPQDVFLLNDTLAANVTFGMPVTPDVQPRIEEALAFAQLTNLVAGLPNGLDTMVGERGTMLSGGQRQRLGLARAMFRRPRVLLLDEATSALDNETEAQITSALRALHGSVTVIVVAHRLSTVRDADQLVFLKGGRVEARGTFHQVESESPDFAALVALGRL